MENALRDIKAKYGDGSIMKLGEAPRVDVDVVPSGSLSLDIALGVGGVPRGKNNRNLRSGIVWQNHFGFKYRVPSPKKGGVCAFIDAEHALDPEYAKKLGVKIDDLLISQPDTGEQALEITESLVRSGGIDVIVIDSVAALTPKAEIEGEMGASHMGLQARLMSQALRKLTAITAKSKTIVIFINQIRMQIGVFFGNPETTTGGKALKFYSSVRIEVRKAAQIKKGEEVIGNRVKVKIVKNKVAAPFKTAEFDIIFNEGISYTGDILNLGEKYEIIKKSGASYSYEGTSLGRGYDSAKTFLMENPKVTKELETKIKEAAKQASQ